MNVTTYENLLVTMAFYAGEFYDMGIIDLPAGDEGEDALVDCCVRAVEDWLARPDDDNTHFWDYCAEKLVDRFGRGN